MRGGPSVPFLSNELSTETRVANAPASMLTFIAFGDPIIAVGAWGKDRTIADATDCIQDWL
jgi:hypothetical protein